MLDRIFRNQAFAQPGAHYIALSQADPLDDGSGIVEPSSNGYARVSIASFNAASNRAKSNSAIITFPLTTGQWGNGTMTHFAIFDHATAGNMLAHGPLDSPIDVSSAGIAPDFQVGQLVIRVKGNVQSAISGTIWSDALSNSILNHCFGGSAYTPPATVYCGFSTADPLSDFSGVAEPSGNNYGRTAVTFSAAAAGQITNSAAVQFPDCQTATWGALTHMIYMTAASGGTFMAGVPLTNPQTVNVGQAPRFAIGGLVLSVN